MTTKSSFARYAFMLFSTILLIVVLPLNLAKSGDLVLLCLHGVSILMSLIYLPAAVYLSVKHRNNKFDHAGGEIAYVVMQMATWIAGGIEACVLSVWSYTCKDISVFDLDQNDYAAANRNAKATCASLAAVGALSLVVAVIHIAWLTLIVVKAHKVKGFSVNQAYLIPTHFLLEGNFNRDPKYWESSHKDDGVDDSVKLDQYPAHGSPITRTGTDDTRVSTNDAAFKKDNINRV